MHQHVSKLMINFNFHKNYLGARLNAHKNTQINQIKSYLSEIKFFWVLQILHDK